MEKLKCDICGSSLVMQEGGELLVCEYCGVKYNAARIKEKVLEIRSTARVDGVVQVSQTGSSEDVAQWHKLAERYYSVGDFSAAEQTITKILAASPDDAEANRKYNDLQTLKYMVVVNGVLTKYTGCAEQITIPNCVKEIGYGVFSHAKRTKHIIIEDGVQKIGSCAFRASSIESISIPESVTNIGEEAFAACRNLSTVSIPERFITKDVFEERLTDEDHNFYGRYSDTTACPWYKKILSEEEKKKAAAREKRSNQLKKKNLCTYCGGAFRSSFWSGKLTCSRCHQEKNY